MRVRATQTNEAGRCAVLLPVLAALPQPLALLEVGASAGLCLYPDRYAYRYGDRRTRRRRAGPRVRGDRAGPADRRARGGVAGRPGPEPARRDRPGRRRVARRPHLARARAPPRPAAGRGGRRRGRTAAAVRGDLVDDLPALAARAPAGATLVVFHTSVLYQVPPPRRAAFTRGTRPARALDRERGPGRAALRRPAGATGRGVAQRAGARRHTAGLDPGARPGDPLVRAAAAACPRCVTAA